MKIGQLVMLVKVDTFMPPLGSRGEIAGSLDEYGDHAVFFAQHPCPAGPDITWEIPAKWLIPLNDIKIPETQECETTL